MSGLQLTEERDGVRLYALDSWESALSEMTAPPVWKRYKSSVANEASESWDLNAGWEGANRLLRDGWPEGRERLAGLTASALAAAPPRMIASRHLDVAGAFPIAALAAAGDPLSMVCLGDTRVSARPVVSILIDQGFSASVPASTIANRGAAIAAWIDRLSDAGYSVGLDMINNCGSGSGTWSIRFPLKRPSEPLEMDRLAFALIHPAMFRRLGFRLIERLDRDAESKLGSGYGSPARARFWTYEDLAQPVYFGPLNYGGEGETECATLAGADSWVGKRIEESLAGGGGA